MRHLAYVRSSRPPKAWRDRNRDSDDESPLGIESQRREILAQFPEAIFFEDRFRSGRSARRPGLMSLLDAVEPGDLVIVSRLDRLARDVRVAVAIEHSIEVVKEGRIVSLAGEGTNRDGSPPDATSVFIRRILAATAELSAAQASTATRAALAVKRAEGRSTNGRAVFGYRIGADGILEEDPEEQATLARVLEITRDDPATGSPSDVATMLNREGRFRRDGKPWDRWTARAMLRRLGRRLEEATV